MISSGVRFFIETPPEGHNVHCLENYSANNIQYYALNIAALSWVPYFQDAPETTIKRTLVLKALPLFLGENGNALYVEHTVSFFNKYSNLTAQ